MLTEAQKLDLYAEAARIIKRHPELSIANLTLAQRAGDDDAIPYPARSPQYQRIWARRRKRRQRGA